MPKIVVTTRDGAEVIVDAKPGRSVMENIRDGGVEEMVALCGGVKSCATCHVFVEADWVARVGVAMSDENELLDESSHKQATSRLACQIVMTEALDGLRVAMAPED